MDRAEQNDIARACAEAYVRLVGFYREQGNAPTEADALARTPRATVAATPSHDLAWVSLNGLLEADPAAAHAVWERVKGDAAGYVADGYHVADALRYSSPWERAQFVALRQALHADWRPTSAVERTLLDTYVASYVAYTHWLGKVHERDLVPARPRGDGWDVPMQATADAIDQAAAMADRFHRQLVRTLRAMRDLRRYSITINGPVGQLNVAQQQVNAAQLTPKGATDV